MRKMITAVAIGAAFGLALAAPASAEDPTPTPSVTVEPSLTTTPEPEPTVTVPTSPPPTTVAPTTPAPTTPAPTTPAPTTPPATTAPPTTPPAEPDPCEAYFYTGTDVSLCRVPEFAGPDVTGITCADVVYRVTLVDKNVDPWGLDGNQGTPGIGCEANPLAPVDPDPTTAAPGGGAGDLPVTGASVPTLALWGLGAVAVGAFGVAGTVWYRRREDARFTA